MKYRPRPGIVRTAICGRTVLIPTRAAFDDCKTVQILPPIWAGTWGAICAGFTREQIVKELSKRSKTKTEAECAERLDQFCRMMCEKGFLIPVPEETDG